MNVTGVQLTLSLAICGAGASLEAFVPEKRVPAVLAWVGALASLLAIGASTSVLATGQPFHAALWTIPSIGTLRITLDRLSALFLLVAYLGYAPALLVLLRGLVRVRCGPTGDRGRRSRSDAPTSWAATGWWPRWTRCCAAGRTSCWSDRGTSGKAP